MFLYTFIMLNLYIRRQGMKIYGNSIGAKQAKFINVSFVFEIDMKLTILSMLYSTKCLF